MMYPDEKSVEGDTGADGDGHLAELTIEQWLLFLGPDPRSVLFSPTLRSFRIPRNDRVYTVHPRVVWAFIMPAVLGVEVRPLDIAGMEEFRKIRRERRAA